jgi:hypothetical protein
MISEFQGIDENGGDADVILTKPTRQRDLVATPHFTFTPTTTFSLMRWGLKKLLLTILLPSLNDGDNISSLLQEPPSPTAVYAGVAAHLEAETSQRAEPERPRPEQGGQRITTAWLHTLRPRDILYRFRYASYLNYVYSI